MKICFISSLVGNNLNNIDKPGNFKKFHTDTFDFFLFTNIKDFKHDSWNVIHVEDSLLNEYAGISENSDNRSDQIYKSRYFKFMGWDYIKNHLKKDYDVIFYCDAIYTPNHLTNWQYYVKKILESESGIIQKKHPKKNTIYSECNAIIGCRKDSEENMKKMIEFFEKNNTPKDFVISENTSFGYNPNNKKITDAFSQLWKTYITEKITYRDQPLWGYISHKNDIKPCVINELHKCKDSTFNHLFIWNGKSFNRHRTYL